MQPFVGQAAPCRTFCCPLDRYAVKPSVERPGAIRILPGRLDFRFRGSILMPDPFEAPLIMTNEVTQNLKSQSTWMRGLYMLIFAVCYTIAEIVLFAVIVFQFLLKLFTADTNDRLRKLGQGLSTYIYQILQYMNFNSDYQPYPFGAWPKGEPKASKAEEPPG
jgi:hypothetical protein